MAENLPDDTRGIVDPAAMFQHVDFARAPSGPILEEVVATRDPTVIDEARQVVVVARLAEHDRTVCRVEQLAAAAGTSVRTSQRLFDQHVGASPSFVIRRWRIIEAAEAARAAIDPDTDWPGWATVAADLGYADQAHLTRDFRRHLGTSPSAYLHKVT